MISPTDISTSASRVLAQYDVSEAYLFGSFARGEQTPDSDIDLRLVCGNTMTFGTLYELSHELERELGRKVDIVTNPPEHMRPAFRKSIEQDEARSASLNFVAYFRTRRALEASIELKLGSRHPLAI